MKRTRRTAVGLRAWALVLALALLVPAMQVGALAHGLSHLSGEAGEGAPQVGDACDACVGFTALGAAIDATPPRFVCAVRAHAVPAPPAVRAGHARTSRPYHARAPPLPSA